MITFWNLWNRGKNVDTVYLDFKKAYDKVDQWVLIQKLASVGFKGNFGKWLSTFIIDRTQAVKIGQNVSSSVKILSGVPQGSVLGPVLFLLFISDIGYKSNSKAYLYVDDSKIISDISMENEVGEFQEDLDQFYDWALKNNMSFNESKFVVLRYGKNTTLKQNTTYFTENLNLPIDEFVHHKDLGVIMSADGKFDDHISSVIKRKLTGFAGLLLIERHIL